MFLSARSPKVFLSARAERNRFKYAFGRWNHAHAAHAAACADQAAGARRALTRAALLRAARRVRAGGARRASAQDHRVCGDGEVECDGPPVGGHAHLPAARQRGGRELHRGEQRDGEAGDRGARPVDARQHRPLPRRREQGDLHQRAARAHGGDGGVVEPPLLREREREHVARERGELRRDEVVHPFVDRRAVDRPQRYGGVEVRQPRVPRRVQGMNLSCFVSPSAVGASQRRWAPSDTRNELGIN
eukprot:gene10668-biopygen4247